MELLIVRHGEAVDDAPGLGDHGRWLTTKGRQITRQVGGWLCEHEHHTPKEIWTSPLVRAVQTAEVIAEQISFNDEVVVFPQLSTHGDPRELQRLLSRYEGPGPLAIVGHEPNLSQLVVQILDYPKWPGFKKSAVLCLKWDGKTHAHFRFLLNPKDLHVIKDLSSIG